MKTKTVHLVSNAHIDPVWQWDVEEGIGTALATFRCAARFCEENEGYVFNHNEAVLYRWVERYDPPLFERIRRLVAAGKWVVMGGFELQPDCVMPSGEAYIRLIQRGRAYFAEKFGVRSRTAVNFDSFGHNRGLVQILAKCGYDAYLFMRPEAHKAALPEDFVWVGYDGSEILAHRLSTGYNSPLGENRRELEGWLRGRTVRNLELYTWGVGNHGGGPSQKDIDDIAALIREQGFPDTEFIHSSPDRYFDELRAALKQGAQPLERIGHSLARSNVGCYTSMAELKKLNRQIESALVFAEKISVAAMLSQGAAYPEEELDRAWEALAFLQFHDVLPGTHTQPVQRGMLHKAGYAMELARGVSRDAFFHLLNAQAPVAPGVIPIFVFNPHPYPVTDVVECEYILQDQNWNKNTVTRVRVTKDGAPVPAQIIKEDSAIPIDWRKKAALWATLPPYSMSRYDCEMYTVPAEQTRFPQDTVFEGDALRCVFNPESGFIDSVTADGRAFAMPSLGQIWLYADDEDPWHMRSDHIDRALRPLEHVKGSLRVIEDGDVMRVYESVFEAPGVRAVVRTRLPRRGREITLDVELLNTLPDTMIKLKIDAAHEHAKLWSEGMFGLEPALNDGGENVSQRFDIIRSADWSIGVVNDGVYGGSFSGGVLYKNLLRSPAFCAHPIEDRQIFSDERDHPRMGIGRHNYRFTLLFFPAGEGFFETARRAQTLHEAPMAVNCFPPERPPQGKRHGALALEGRVILSALKKARQGGGLVVRLYEPAGKPEGFTLRQDELSFYDVLRPFEVKTYLVGQGVFRECNMLEELPSDGESERSKPR